MKKDDLIQSIYEVFKDVQLDDGIGLWEARMIDDYYEESDSRYTEVRQKDERKDWKKLLPIFLNQDDKKNYVSDTWTFMDVKGKLFHLPLFLLQDIHYGNSEDYLFYNPIIYYLTIIDSDNNSLEFFKNLNISQKKLLLNFLEYKVHEYIIKNNEDSDYEDKLSEYQKAKENFVRFIYHANHFIIQS
mgnify:CR=1 FL=1